MDIDGLHVGLLNDDELAWFDAECAAGRARRSYEGAAGFMGIAKVRIVRNADE